MEQVGGLFTFLHLFLAASFMGLVQPFKDLHVAQSFYVIQEKVLDLK